VLVIKGDKFLIKEYFRELVVVPGIWVDATFWARGSKLAQHLEKPGSTMSTQHSAELAKRLQELSEALLVLSQRKLFREGVLVYASAAGYPLQKALQLQIRDLSSAEFQAAGQSFAAVCHRQSGVSLNRILTGYISTFSDTVLSDGPAFPTQHDSTTSIQNRTAERALVAAWQSCGVTRGFTYGEIRKLSEFAAQGDVAVEVRDYQGATFQDDNRLEDTVRRVAGYFALLFNNLDEKADAMQEAAILLMQAERRRRVRLNPDTDWQLARRIAQRLRRSWQQQQGARREMPIGNGVEWMPDSHERMFRVRHIRQQGTLEELHEAFSLLPAEQAQLVRLYYGLGDDATPYSLEDLTRMFRLPPSKVQARIRAGIRRLRVALKPDGKV
jgi:DNA-directed RNA polymerase specialized sigma24 family protein